MADFFELTEKQLAKKLVGFGIIKDCTHSVRPACGCGSMGKFRNPLGQAVPVRLAMRSPRMPGARRACR
eukprot:3486626-Alexandrium_andersonii.AAC.1